MEPAGMVGLAEIRIVIRKNGAATWFGQTAFGRAFDAEGIEEIANGKMRLSRYFRPRRFVNRTGVF